MQNHLDDRVRKLGAVDANFFYSETANNPNHIASLQKFELPTGVSSSAFISGLKTFMAKRSHLVPYLTRKVQFMPGGFDHPVWVPVDDFDINNHITEVVLPCPGTLEQLEETTAAIHAELMDRSLPLWKLTVLTGLEDGTVAFYNQVHHACIDGMAGQAATQILMDTSPDHTVAVEPSAGKEPSADKEPLAGAEPSAGSQPSAGSESAGKKLSKDQASPQLLDLYVMSLQNLINFQLTSAGRFIGGIDSLAKLGQRAIDPSKSFGALSEAAPTTAFNQAVTRERSFAVGELPLADAKIIGSTSGCKVNDVFLAICAGGLRKYFQRSYTLPSKALIAGCPVSLRKPGDTGMDNQVTMMSVSLATDIADPRLRLLSIRDSANTAKDVTIDMASGFNADVSLPGLPFVATAMAKLSDSIRLADSAPMPINLVISNVPGPRATLYSNAARMLTHYPVSIPAPGLGVNITVQSYVDTLYFSITACKKALPSAQLLRDDMIAAYQELKQLLPAATVTTITPKAKPKSIPTVTDVIESPNKEGVVPSEMDKVA